MGIVVRVSMGTFRYDTQKGGHPVILDKAKLKAAPQDDGASEFKWTPEMGRKVDSHYEVPSYWTQSLAPLTSFNEFDARQPDLVAGPGRRLAQ
jgi:hypothetical protein